MDDSGYRFCVYIAGQTPAAQKAIKNLDHLIEQHAELGCSVETVDILQTPDAAEESRILATPTIIRLSPTPMIRMVGDLSDEEQAERLFELAAVFD